MNNIRCASCRFVRQDKIAGKRSWIAYVCGNPRSEFYKGLLNISASGEKQVHVSWPGCDYGERRSVL